MPFPVSRSTSLVAIERLLNDSDARPVAREVLADHGNEPEIARALLDAAPAESPARKVIESAMREIGVSARREREYPDLSQPTGTDDIERGRHHLDQHWFRPQDVGDDHTHFWWRYIGEPAPIVRTGLSAALEMAGDDLPIHLIWVCASPTFEVSVSTVRDRSAQREVAVAVVLSTPGTLFSLAHLSDPDEQDDPIELDPPFAEDHVIIGRRGWRNDGVVHQTGRHFRFPEAAPAAD
jgi:hypothetical protein